MRTLHRLVVLLTFGLAQIPWVKSILRRLANRSISLLLRLRSRNYVPLDSALTLIVAPHQDDGTLGCGGLMTRLRLEGQSVHVVYVTDGSASHPEHPTLRPEKLAALRMQEGRAALRQLGVETPAIHALGTRDGMLSHLSWEQSSDFVFRFRQLLIELRPDEVFIPYRLDGSSEHEAAFRLFLDSLDVMESHPRVFEYVVWSWWNPLRLLRPLLTARRVWLFRFPGYEAIKISALQCYRSQFEPTAPWTKPVISPEFVHLFHQPFEFYFEI